MKSFQKLKAMEDREKNKLPFLVSLKIHFIPMLGLIPCNKRETVQNDLKFQ